MNEVLSCCEQDQRCRTEPISQVQPMYVPLDTTDMYCVRRKCTPGLRNLCLVCIFTDFAWRTCLQSMCDSPLCAWQALRGKSLYEELMKQPTMTLENGTS